MATVTFDATTTIAYRTRDDGSVEVEERTTYTSTDPAHPVRWEDRRTRTIGARDDIRAETAEMKAIATAVRTPDRLARADAEAAARAETDAPIGRTP